MVCGPRTPVPNMDLRLSPYMRETHAVSPICTHIRASHPVFSTTSEKFARRFSRTRVCSYTPWGRGPTWCRRRCIDSMIMEMMWYTKTSRDHMLTRALAWKRGEVCIATRARINVRLDRSFRWFTRARACPRSCVPRALPQSCGHFGSRKRVRRCCFCLRSVLLSDIFCCSSSPLLLATSSADVYHTRW